MKIEIPF